MRAWTSATAPGRCAFDRTHEWKQGDRIFRLQGVWPKPKDYCQNCAVARHGAPPDTGEFLDITDSVLYPTPLKALAEATTAKILPFDAKVAAAGKDEDPLFAEPFEEAP